jgi:hypothetical protein
MKTYLINLKSSLFLFSLIILEPLWASELVGKIKTVQGEVFSVYQGKTISLKQDADLYAGTQIMVSEGAECSWHDFKDHQFILSENSHVEVANKGYLLQRGNIWVQSLSKELRPLTVETINGFTEMMSGEAIVSFDPFKTKTQLLVIGGESTIANKVESSFKFSVTTGQFSFIESNSDQGFPRNPTKIGLDSMNLALKQFKAAPSIENKIDTKIERIPASVDGNQTQVAPKGEIIFISHTQNKRSPNSVEGEALNYFKNFSSKPKKLKNKSSNLAPVRIFRVKSQTSEVALKTIETKKTVIEKKRVPASEVKLNSPMKNSVNEFEESLKNHEKLQPPHKEEVQRLINDLKSF